MRRAERPLRLRHAAALGLLQGPTELLPVSSSAHTTLAPWLAGWGYERLDPHARKSFELALHAGAGLALALAMRSELTHDAARLDSRRAAALALSIAPPALAGALLRGPIERRLSGPRAIAAGLLGGALAMVLADRSGARRDCAEAGPGDGLAVGLAQALALAPGVSRSGAALTAARARGFGRGAAHRLSWDAALPLLLGASAVECLALARGPARPHAASAAVGGLAAFASTLLSARVLTGRALRESPLLPFAAYRAALAAGVLARLRTASPR